MIWNTESRCRGCGHIGKSHNPGSYRNADQRAVHYGCNYDRCECLQYCDETLPCSCFRGLIKEPIMDEPTRNRTPLEHRLAAEEYLMEALDEISDNGKKQVLLLAAIAEALLAGGGGR